MIYSIVYEKVNDNTLPDGFYYAHVPALDLTNHGLGIEGAKNSALDLIKLWIEEKKANNKIAASRNFQFSIFSFQ